MNTIQLLDAVKARHGLKSDYAAAELLGLTRSQISRYRNGQDFFSDPVAIKVASLLGDDPGAVLIHINAERAKDDNARAVWRGLAVRLKGGAYAAGLALFLGGWGGGPDGGAMAATSPDAVTHNKGAVYIMSNRLRGWILSVIRMMRGLTGAGLAPA